MERKLKPIYVQSTLKEKKLRLFSPEELRRLFSVTLRASQEFIKDHQSDLFIKLRNGLYGLKSDPPTELEVANRLYLPSYVSFEYALAHYRIIPESVYTITSATSKITREFIVQGKSYEYYRIKREAYRGYRAEKVGQSTILIAEPEKALIDYLYFVDLKKRTLNDRLNIRNIQKKLVIHYASIFKRQSLTKLVKSII